MVQDKTKVQLELGRLFSLTIQFALLLEKENNLMNQFLVYGQKMLFDGMT